MSQLKITELTVEKQDLDLSETKSVKGGRDGDIGILNSSDSFRLDRLLSTGGRPGTFSWDYTPDALWYRY